MSKNHSKNCLSAMNVQNDVNVEVGPRKLMCPDKKMCKFQNFGRISSPTKGLCSLFSWKLRCLCSFYVWHPKNVYNTSKLVWIHSYSSTTYRWCLFIFFYTSLLVKSYEKWKVKVKSGKFECENTGKLLKINTIQLFDCKSLDYQFSDERCTCKW